MAMLIDCPSVPVPEDEKIAITEAAYNSRSEDRSDTDFESVSITKCITNWEWDEPERIEGRTENVDFYGLFPHTLETENYRERYSIRCHKSLDYRDNVVFDQRDSCSEELERYMHYEGLENEIRLRGSVSVEDAAAYLDYLLQYDFGADAQNRVNGMLQQIQRVDRRIVRGQLRFTASFNHGGCATTTFETTAERMDSLAFGEVDGHMSIC
jgi:hypothetical protein